MLQRPRCIEVTASRLRSSVTGVAVPAVYLELPRFRELARRASHHRVLRGGPAVVSQVRSAACSQPLIYHADKYTASQHLGRTLRKPGPTASPIREATGSRVSAPPSSGRHFYCKSGSSGISATSGIVGMAGKSRPSTKCANSTMTGCPEVPISNLPANRSNESTGASCAAYAVARQEGPARHLGESGGGVEIPGGQSGSRAAVSG